MRLLPVSATKTFPLPSTATPVGPLNCPSPVPELPHMVRKVPVFVNFWMRELPRSATKTFPLPSTATPTGPVVLPHLVTKGHGSAGSHTHPQEFAPVWTHIPDAMEHVPPHVGAWEIKQVWSDVTHSHEFPPDT